MLLAIKFPLIYFILTLTIINPFMLIDAEFIIFLSVSLVVILAYFNLNELLAKNFNIKLLQYQYYVIRNYNINLWFIYLLNEFLQLRLFIYLLPFYLKWFNFYKINFDLLFNNQLKLLYKNWVTLNLNLSINFLKKIKLALFLFYVDYFWDFYFKVSFLFLNYKLANYRLLVNYLLNNKTKVILKRSKFDSKNIKKKYF